LICIKLVCVFNRLFNYDINLFLYFFCINEEKTKTGQYYVPYVRLDVCVKGKYHPFSLALQTMLTFI